MKTAITAIVAGLASVTAFAAPKALFSTDQFENFTLHTYASFDAMTDVSFIVEGDNSLVVIEPQAFEGKVEEFTAYTDKLGKPIEKVLVSFHAAGLKVYADEHKVIAKPMAEFMESDAAKGMLGFYLGPGETDDAMFIWMPKEKVLFAGDNFYSSFPNLYAIRGTAYRDVLNWSDSVAKMAEFNPQYLVPGHTMPILGQATAVAALENYSEAIRSVYEQTVKGINAGKGPDQIAHEVALPAHLKDKPHLIEFYGTVPHSVRAIYAGLLGWFDGNPTTLNPLQPKLKARKMAELSGGTRKLTKQMEAALAQGEYQWALELSDHVKWLDDADRPLARKTKIAALRALAAREYNAPNRNYYLSYANELESGQLSDLWF